MFCPVKPRICPTLHATVVYECYLYFSACTSVESRPHCSSASCCQGSKSRQPQQECGSLTQWHAHSHKRLVLIFHWAMVVCFVEIGGRQWKTLTLSVPTGPVLLLCSTFWCICNIPGGVSSDEETPQQKRRRRSNSSEALAQSRAAAISTCITPSRATYAQSLTGSQHALSPVKKISVAKSPKAHSHIHTTTSNPSQKVWMQRKLVCLLASPFAWHRRSLCDCFGFRSVLPVLTFRQFHPCRVCIEDFSWWNCVPNIKSKLYVHVRGINQPIPAVFYASALPSKGWITMPCSARWPTFCQSLHFHVLTQCVALPLPVLHDPSMEQPPSVM